MCDPPPGRRALTVTVARDATAARRPGGAERLGAPRQLAPFAFAATVDDGSGDVALARQAPFDKNDVPLAAGCALALRKWIFTRAQEAFASDGPAAVELIYQQAKDDLRTGRIVADAEARRQLHHHALNQSKQAYLDVARRLAGYASLTFAGCVCDAMPGWAANTPCSARFGIQGVTITAPRQARCGGRPRGPGRAGRVRLREPAVPRHQAVEADGGRRLLHDAVRGRGRARVLACSCVARGRRHVPVHRTRGPRDWVVDECTSRRAACLASSPTSAPRGAAGPLLDDGRDGARLVGRALLGRRRRAAHSRGRAATCGTGRLHRRHCALDWRARCCLIAAAALARLPSAGQAAAGRGGGAGCATTRHV